MHTRCWSACKQGVVFLLFTLPSWCQMSWWTFCFTLKHNTVLSIYQAISLYKKLSTPQNLPYLKQSLGEIPGEDCRLLSTIWCEWWNRVTGFTVPGSVFNPLLAVMFLVSHEVLLTMQQRLPMIFLTFLLHNQEHGVNNERSQLMQSVRHSKWTHRMWPC